MKHKISAYCKIKNNQCWVNQDLMLTHQNQEQSFAKELYQKLNIKYPKFYKMDILAKYAFLSSEIVLQKQKTLHQYNDNQVALLFCNSNSSTLTDLKYQKSISNEKPSPSPSLFVYTLPNISLGEVAIRNKWYGENLFFIRPHFDIEFLYQYAKILLQSHKACIIAWIDIKNDEKDVLLLSVEPTQADEVNSLLFNKENLKKIYTQ